MQEALAASYAFTLSQSYRKGTQRVLLAPVREGAQREKREFARAFLGPGPGRGVCHLPTASAAVGAHGYPPVKCQEGGSLTASPSDWLGPVSTALVTRELLASTQLVPLRPEKRWNPSVRRVHPNCDSCTFPCIRKTSQLNLGSAFKVPFIFSSTN